MLCTTRSTRPPTLPFFVEFPPERIDFGLYGVLRRYLARVFSIGKRICFRVEGDVNNRWLARNSSASAMAIRKK